MKRSALLFALALAVALPLSAQLTPGPVAPNTRWPILGDVNGDGLADVIDDTTVQINAGGTLQDPVKLPVSGRVLDVLDVNGDGVADLLTSYDPPIVDRPIGPYLIWINDGHGNFTPVIPPAGRFTDTKGLLALPPMVGDFDGDGKDDLILFVPVYNGAAHNTYVLTFYRSLGDGTFDATDIHEITRGEIWLNPFQSLTNMRQHVTLGDLDHDGNPELVIREMDRLVIFSGLGNGKFAAPKYLYLPLDYGEGNGMVVADIDGDGNNDLARVNGWGRVFVMFGDGQGGFDRMATAVTGDLTGDQYEFTRTMEVLHYTSANRYDIVVGAYPGGVSVVTYEDGVLHVTTSLHLLDPNPPGTPRIPGSPTYRALNVFAGKLRAGAPVDVYAFEAWGYAAQSAQLVFVTPPPAGQSVRPPRHRATGAPGRLKGSAVRAMSLRVVSTGMCPAQETWSLQRQGLFASGTSSAGYDVDVFMPDDSEIWLTADNPDVRGHAFRPDLTFYSGRIEWHRCNNGPAGGLVPVIIYP